MPAFTRFDLSDEEYANIEGFLPPERSGQSGRPFRSHKQVINGIFWIQRTGSLSVSEVICFGWDGVSNRYTIYFPL